MNNIIRVSCVQCNKISGFRRLSETEAVINPELPLEELKTIKHPSSLIINDKIEDGQRIFQTKLTIKLCGSISNIPRRMAYLCETVDGERYLIGNNERPYPVVTQQENHPESYSDSQLTEYVISWNSTKKPPVIR